jgi:putative hydrolase of the HAD superfamily
MTIDTLFLDAGGVLIFPNWQRITDVLRRYGVSIDPKVLAAADPYVKRRIDTSDTIATSTDAQRSFPYFSLVLSEAGVAQNEQTEAALTELHTYHDAHNLWESVPPDVMPALARLRSLGLQLVVISNANGTLHGCFDRVGLTSCLDAAFDSRLEGVEKPDPRLFHIGLQRAGSTPERTMHVGDIYHVDVVGARNAGIRPMLLDPVGLYEDADCPRVRTLAELADGLEAGLWDQTD